MRYLSLRDGAKIPLVGQGSWYMGDDPSEKLQEQDALRAGIAEGMNLLDSAEMYGSGRSERLLGSVVPEYKREELFLVSKVYPHNAGRAHIFESCEASIKRMNAEYLDLYLLHWRGSVPLSETVACMEELIKQGKIRRWGVSNFDVDDMEELFRVKNGENCAVNQVLYHLGSRGVEYDLLPWLNSHDVPLMAYCPLAQGGSLRRGLLEDRAVKTLAAKHNASPTQILLAFLLSHPGVFAIPKSSKKEHTLENARAAEIILTAEDLALLDRSFLPPKRKMYLDIV